ncbi:hypothetical protein VM94_03007 [Janthinobacterium sp. KBS0711]|uniref:hypothetical protein n=1 Tax=unclassified Janthinobacterium TaxID=2610881 RepID=UPI0006282903|nr:MULTISPECIES: hypothetical protein [unclassified Janthinobacterium]KKO63257.1 hypothetical protein VM94_03007 [Janthinobacterium sp. KBS0711]TSD72760.1 hypothetical protein FFI39_018245 [Janthinobacterium sp. KBS0711]
MKPSLSMVAMLLLLGAAVFCAQRWGRETGRAACAAQVLALQAVLQRQNQALNAMREEDARRSARVRQALATAQAGQADAQAAAARILALQPEGDACRAAEALIASEMP